MYVRIVQAGAMKRHFRRPGADSLFCKDNSNILNPNRSSDHFCQQFIAFSHFKTSSFRLPAASLSFFCAIIHHRHSQKNVNPLPKCRTFFLSLQKRESAPGHPKKSFQDTHVSYPCKSLAILPDFCRVADAVDSVSATMLQLLLFRLSANGWKCFADLLRKFEHDIGHLPTVFLFF